MKLRTTALIIFSLLINLFSSVVVNAQESGAITTAALNNTMHATTDFFVSYCIATTIDIVLGMDSQAEAASAEKSAPKKSSKDCKDLEQIFFAQTCGNTSLNLLQAKVYPVFVGVLAQAGSDLESTILLTKFLKQFYIFLILMALLLLLPRGKVDYYAILNTNNLRG